ncbi:hypothetical protein Q765_02245 [Flavobacterium rivuli WB 3.3-2 = DSM 21788]|uniref:Gliding motility-associated protein GldM second immunoglobulin-like domain-containing protein n=1 Tax=Flavobacterium rivuli WB 3.3-2 = DSM 21788 TaxID=1121895 RepID=A0A0A2M906_9FLAO|nr:GldM family protein [Flavobacterium rivuli]KGO88739.1 hypothetical protein Q765_02245 [Flavobacterium rivuli WB 3.3-2 = DSM 21788]
MKYFLILLFSISAFAQSDSISRANISVVSAERLNIVYRGIDNPIKIAVPGAVSFIATAKDSALVKIDNLGNYTLRAGSGSKMKIYIDAIMQDNSTLHEEKVFRILGLPAPTGLINGENCEICTVNLSKEELANAIISVGIKDFSFIDRNSDFFVARSFVIIINEKEIPVEGNKISIKALKTINKLKSGSILIIDKIKYGKFSVEAIPKRASPIVVEISGE